jgi:hypothetical protein
MAAALAVGCGGDDSVGLFGEASGANASGADDAGSEGGPGGSSAGEAATGSSASGGEGADGSESAAEGPKFDTPDGAEGADEGGPGSGCDKVDFLFVIDNSLSMGDEQQNLTASFPSFIQTIQTDVVDDWRVLLIDTDGEDKWDEELAECHESKCIGEPPDEPCGVITPQDLWTCGNLPTPDACDAQLGAGNDHDDSEQRVDCGIAGGKRWFDDAQPDPDGTFDCIANLYEGNSPELTMQGMLTALQPPMVGPGGCNEGFLREDAVLVVTFITDEEDSPGDSLGDPASWHADLLAIKNGNETAVVVLGLVGDTGLPGAVCPPDSMPGSTGGEYSPRLIEFVESFGTRGLWGSVCSPDYGPFFEQAVALIDTACDEFEPEG